MTEFYLLNKSDVIHITRRMFFKAQKESEPTTIHIVFRKYVNVCISCKCQVSSSSHRRQR